MRYFILAILLLPSYVSAQFGGGGFGGGGGGGGGGGSTVTVSAPIQGDGSQGAPLQLDGSSVTLQGNTVSLSYLSSQVSTLNTSTNSLQSSKYDKTGGTITGDVTVTGFTIVGGVKDYGARTATQIRLLACSSSPCRVQNTTDFDLYVDTGILTGQWKNQGKGTAP